MDSGRLVSGLATCVYCLDDNPEAMVEISSIRSGSGYIDLKHDLRRLAIIYRAHASDLSGKKYDAADEAQALALADEINVHENGEQSADQRLLERRVWTLLKAKADRAYEAAVYVTHHLPQVRASIRSIHTWREAAHAGKPADPPVPPRAHSPSTEPLPKAPQEPAAATRQPSSASRTSAGPKTSIPAAPFRDGRRASHRPRHSVRPATSGNRVAFAARSAASRRTSISAPHFTSPTSRAWPSVLSATTSSSSGVRSLPGPHQEAAGRQDRSNHVPRGIAVRTSSVALHAQ